MELKVKTIWNCRVCFFWASLMTFLFLCTNGAMGAEEDSLKADSTITSRFRASLMVTQPSKPDKDPDSFDIDPDEEVDEEDVW